MNTSEEDRRFQRFQGVQEAERSLKCVKNNIKVKNKFLKYLK